VPFGDPVAAGAAMRIARAKAAMSVFMLGLSWRRTIVRGSCVGGGGRPPGPASGPWHASSRATVSRLTHRRFNRTIQNDSDSVGGNADGVRLSMRTLEKKRTFRGHSLHESTPPMGPDRMRPSVP
jgi:hypothetical protein